MTKPPDPDHPIIDEAWKHEIVGLHWDPLARDPFLDLVLRHAETGVIRRLRFTYPTGIRFESGFPHMTWGLAIADVRHRQMEGIGIHVYDFENSSGGLEFFAREVIELPDSTR